jgi:hypothetical protein
MGNALPPYGDEIPLVVSSSMLRLAGQCSNYSCVVAKSRLTRHAAVLILTTRPYVVTVDQSASATTHGRAQYDQVTQTRTPDDKPTCGY